LPMKLPLNLAGSRRFSSLFNIGGCCDYVFNAWPIIECDIR
jgi:hypothetical protein